MIHVYARQVPDLSGLRMRVSIARLLLSFVVLLFPSEPEAPKRIDLKAIFCVEFSIKDSSIQFRECIYIY